MELKQCTSVCAGKRVRAFNRTSLELKLAGVEIQLVIDGAFNRTSLELKRDAGTYDFDAVTSTFNRTSLELKLSNVDFGLSIDDFTFNRTSLELKRCSMSRVRLRQATFNRTSLELKQPPTRQNQPAADF